MTSKFNVGDIVEYIHHESYDYGTEGLHSYFTGNRYKVVNV